MVELIKNYSEWFALKYEITYFYNAYGPGQVRTGDYATVIGIFEEQFENREPLTVVSPGNQTRDFTHVNDIVIGVILAAEKGKQAEYPLGTGVPHKIIDVAKMFGDNYTMIPEPQRRTILRKGNSITHLSAPWLASINQVGRLHCKHSCEER